MNIDRSPGGRETGRGAARRALVGAVLLAIAGPAALPAQQSPLAGENVYPPASDSRGFEVTGYLSLLTPLSDLASLLMT